jgi:NAD(P)-dependent dehydrogenase (short-subunit alcohol dehydrogenase family)
VTLQLTETTAVAATGAPFAKGEIVVVSGGARGVTAEVAVAVARSTGATLLLLGRSAPPTPEPDWLAGLTEEGEIKRELLAHGGPAAPKDLGEAYRKALANREVLLTLRRIEQAGGRALYRQVDVRDADAVAAVLAEVRGLGSITGLVHGAGVLADRRIEDKTPEQFANVWDTKVGGLRTLLAATANDPLKAIALFSSSTGRFGRSGQIDYAAANEALNKFAQAEARRRPNCRVVALNWGPWDGGMVTPGLKKVFAGEGVGVIPLAEGAEFFVRELRSEPRPVEIVVLAGEAPGLTPPSPASALPVAFEREVSPESVPVLRAHVIAGKAVVPMALSVEWLGHAALHANPGLVFQGCDDLRVLKGLRLDEGERCLVRVRAGKATKDGDLYRVAAELRSVGATGKETLHVAATVVLAAKLPAADTVPPPPVLKPYGRTIAAAYEEVLFHGPALRGLTRIDGCSEQGVAAAVTVAPPPSEWLRQPLRGAWLADPLVLDCAFQLMILWSQEVRGAPSLPCAAGRYRQFVRSFPREEVRVAARITRDAGQRIVADIWFLDKSGAAVARMSDYECVIDPALTAAFRRNQLTRETQPLV